MIKDLLVFKSQLLIDVFLISNHSIFQALTVNG